MISVNGTTRTVRVGKKQGTELSIEGFLIRVLEGPDAGLASSGNVDTVRIGSDPTNELVLTDPAVSRRHVEIRLTAGGSAIRDLGSKNGTWVNGVRIESGIVPERGQVRLGGTLLEIVSSPRRMVVFPEPDTNFCGIISHNSSMWDIFSLMKQMAKFDLPVMICGETGTGKDLLARSLHDSGPRSEKPFVVLDCGSVVSSLLASQILGTEKGAFTGAERSRPGIFELASGGTVFLDEIGELDLELQSHLLRVVEAKQVTRLGAQQSVPVNFRLVSATNRDLSQMVEEGLFRSDLYFRLSAVTVSVPPLRDRPEDILPLAEFCLNRCAQTNQIDIPPMSGEAQSMLKSCTWKGNVRELRNAMETLCVLAEGRPITAAQILKVIPKASAPDVAAARPIAKPQQPPVTNPPAGNNNQQMDEIERGAVLAALNAAGWNRSKAATRLGISRSALYAKIERHGLKQPGVIPDDTEGGAD